jgi:hypothetical protein
MTLRAIGGRAEVRATTRQPAHVPPGLPHDRHPLRRANQLRRAGDGEQEALQVAHRATAARRVGLQGTHVGLPDPSVRCAGGSPSMSGAGNFTLSTSFADRASSTPSGPDRSHGDLSPHLLGICVPGRESNPHTSCETQDFRPPKAKTVTGRNGDCRFRCVSGDCASSPTPLSSCLWRFIPASYLPVRARGL